MVAIQRQLKIPLAEIRALEWSVRVRVLRLYACTDVSPVLRNGLVNWRESNKVRERKGTRSCHQVQSGHLTTAMYAGMRAAKNNMQVVGTTEEFREKG